MSAFSRSDTACGTLLDRQGRDVLSYDLPRVSCKSQGSVLSRPLSALVEDGIGPEVVSCPYSGAVFF